LTKTLTDSAHKSTGLLVAGEAPPFSVLNPGAPSRLLLLGDHAGREIPRRLGDLGLPEAQLQRHIAWDIGVAGMGAHLAAVLNATLIAQRYSRLVIDCNRDPARGDAVCQISDDVAIPGNRDLSAADRAARVREVFAPYHDRIGAELDERLAAGARPVVVALHSFTPVMAGQARPWRFGILHLGGSPFCEAMLRGLRTRFGEAEVGDNQPYRMDGTDYTVPWHAVRRELDYLELEVRQDLLADEAAQVAVAEALAPLLDAAAREALS
jgi:predicted N-formylglutamate amidohydrolase